MTDKQLGTFLHQYADKLQMKLSESNGQLLEHLDNTHFIDIKIGNKMVPKCRHLFPVNNVITQMRRDANELIGKNEDKNDLQEVVEEVPKRSELTPA